MIRALNSFCCAFVATVASLSLSGCGSDSDLAATYDLENVASSRGPGVVVSEAADYLEERLRSREGDPKYIVGETQENLESFEPGDFGERASVFEQIERELAELQTMVDKKTPRAELIEKAATIKELSNQLKSPPG